MTTDSRPGTVISQLALRGLLELADTVCTRRGVTREELCGSGKMVSFCQEINDDV